MEEKDFGLRLTRRDMLANLAAFALSLTGAGALAQGQRRTASLARWNDRYEVALSVGINQQEGRRSRRPYVAIWVENAEGASVRTLSLWVQRSGRGPRWIPDLRRWFRNERERQAESGGDLVATVSSATRAPGTYTVTWNGRDDAGSPVEQGRYFLCVEAAREHGTYQLIRQDFNFASRAFTQELPGNAEIRGVTVEYRERK